MSRSKTSEVLKRVREICLSLPETAEKEAWSTPTFRVKKKMFAMFVDDHHGDGRVALWLDAPPGDQELLVAADPVRFFIPPYQGPFGWIGVRVDLDPDWGEVRELVVDAYPASAPENGSRQARRARAGHQGASAPHQGEVVLQRLAAAWTFRYTYMNMSPALEVGPVSRLFRALGDETRLRIVALLAHQELCVCHLQEALDLPQPRVSRHLGILRTARVVESRRDGSWIYYKLSPQPDSDCAKQLKALVRSFGERRALRRDLTRLLKRRGPEACR